MTAPKQYSTAEIRQKFLEFFASKEHLILPGHSVIAPDPTTMFTVAGMQQFKPQFMGAPAQFSEGTSQRVTTAQKCVRMDDIENVGRTRRHLSLFEMMGNFSFGNYFKREAIAWAWEFLTSPDWMGFDKDRMYVTVYVDDDEAFGYWTGDHGLPASHIHRFGADENFWPADAPLKGPNGPCGPCSEIYYDRGEKYGSDTWEDYAQTRESARFLEVWNLVFPQFDRQGLDESGTPILAPLPYQNIDTGMGLERVASVVQDEPDFYTNDVFRPLIDKIAELSGVPYEGEQSVSHRVIAEHARSVSMVIADGVTLSNTGRGYVVRKVLRRASRHAYLLGLTEPSIYRLVPIVVSRMKDGYPELVQEQERIAATIKGEEERFLRTLEEGIGRLNALLQELGGEKVLSGDDAFTLYDTYGFPLDLTQEIAEEQGVSVDVTGYELALERAQETARAGSKFGKGELFDSETELVKNLPATEFVGYDELDTAGEVLAVLDTGGEQDRQTVVLSRTPFYAEGGGEVGDTGRLEWEGGEGRVLNTRKNSGVWLHDVEVTAGQLTQGQRVRGVVSEDRAAIQRHHTATHLLHAALKAVLGGDVRQAGSLVAADRLRFDFTHSAPLSAEELAQIEALVSRWISANFAVSWQEMPIAEARAAGATALFGEKYGDTVRVVSVQGDVDYGGVTVSSMELCGGAHVRRTGDIGAFVLLSDENVSAGVRRIEALAGEAATHWLRGQLNTLGQAAALLNTGTSGLEGRIGGLQAQLRAAEKETAQAKAKLAEAQMGGGHAGQAVREIGGYRVAAVQLSGVEGGALRGAADKLLDTSDADLVVVAADSGLVVKASKDAVARGAHAGQLIGKLAAAGGGKGGGRSDMAQAGIQDATAALAALESALG
ncbi:alanine--tRNA ligase [Deinococcus radiophilus]|uniref:Alanine--tRNA ligase n=1 Tax=Deinococcus radiophilus TaxID=32062 RepID=A0A431VQF6_9DEIO|nr:alanine--tRNA ligase [Deinococcus radiophilus]RTR25448.1 alanine--tRNA ligase [Deinococcus radiophilus]